MAGAVKLTIILSFVVMVFGLACLNFTQHSGWDKHTEFATKNGLPEPSYGLFVTGAALAVIGAISFGFAMGRRRRTSASG